MSKKEQSYIPWKTEVTQVAKTLEAKKVEYSELLSVKIKRETRLILRGNI